ncbi:hypothetical protein V6N13_043703 [Hibiscus sabdariffa]|uniref:Uncharacterized protein n=1 Tax=Hibiscus sabdariffa TaxID=183260 RepID=A0ABR2RFY9_9ROSI
MEAFPPNILGSFFWSYNELGPWNFGSVLHDPLVLLQTYRPPPEISFCFCFFFFGDGDPSKGFMSSSSSPIKHHGAFSWFLLLISVSSFRLMDMDRVVRLFVV